jgi:glycosyltransferase involved in cell wall biosynthesis
MPAYNAANTVERTVRSIDSTIVDEIILVDDASSDETVSVANELHVTIAVHERNVGYGGNQKTCYRMALDSGADIIVMVHPDYRYEPKLVPALAYLVSVGIYDVALGSRILGRGAIKGGMPPLKYVANRCLTLFQNLLAKEKLSEYQTGFRAFCAAA